MPLDGKKHRRRVSRQGSTTHLHTHARFVEARVQVKCCRPRFTWAWRAWSCVLLEEASVLAASRSDSTFSIISRRPSTLFATVW